MGEAILGVCLMLGVCVGVEAWQHRVEAGWVEERQATEKSMRHQLASCHAVGGRLVEDLCVVGE